MTLRGQRVTAEFREVFPIESYWIKDFLAKGQERQYPSDLVLVRTVTD